MQTVSFGHDDNQAESRARDQISVHDRLENDSI